MRDYPLYELPLMEKLWAGFAPRAGASVAEIGCGHGSLLTVMSMYGDDYNPSREVNERFRREAAKRFMPGDKFQPQTEEVLREMQRARRRARQR